MQHNVLHNEVMATRVSAAVVRRPSLPLTAQDEAALKELRGSQEMQRALSRLCGRDISAQNTEGSVLQALIETALRVVKAQAQERAYEELARDVTYLEDKRAFRDRRRPSWADEE